MALSISNCIYNPHFPKEKSLPTRQYNLHTFAIELTGLFSLSNHSIFGVGIPLAEQSRREPSVFVKSNRVGGSKLNVGPILSYDAVAHTRSN